MATCDKTNPYFEKLDKEIDDFFSQENWNEIFHDNYVQKKSQVDLQWDKCLMTWNFGVYFNAGMFYANTLILLTDIQVISP